MLVANGSANSADMVGQLSIVDSDALEIQGTRIHLWRARVGKRPETQGNVAFWPLSYQLQTSGRPLLADHAIARRIGASEGLYTSANTVLKRRKLRNPDLSAISIIGSFVSPKRRFAR
jgi:hypothetical protein